MTPRSFPCKRCGEPVSVSDAALRDPAVTLVCGGCGQRYARRAAPTRTGGTSAPTASKFTSHGSAPSLEVGGSEATASRPGTPVGATRSLDVLDTESSPSIFAGGDFVSNRYRIVRFIARGGMGEVYEAEDIELRGRIALKTIRPAAAGESWAVERFKREIHLARQVTHPNVCRIFDVGFHAVSEGDSVVFLTMELLQGETLAARLKRAGRLTTAAALPIATQLADGLAAAHEAGIVHRDFKTENVFLVPGRDGERAVVTDFGIARGGDDRFGVTLTTDGNVIGTPAYMAPEQVEGGEISAATDQYAYGVVLFEMLTGELPFRGENPIATAARRLTEPAPSPRMFEPELDPRWEAAILRCLARRPEERFRDLRSAARALSGAPQATVDAPIEPLTGDEISSEPLAQQTVSRRPDTRKRWVAAALLVALAAVSVWAWLRVLEIRNRLTADAPVVARRSVAVLELRDLAGRTETAWLSTALSEMLATELSQGGDLRVVPGQHAMRALDDLGLGGLDALDRDQKVRLRRRLGADYLVLGSYTALAEGGALRVDLRLEDARGDQTVATVRENGAQAELFELVGEAGLALRRALGADERRSAAPVLPTSPAAARLYAEGLDALRRFEPQRGRRLLEQAVAADPQNALARSALATAWGSLGYAERSADEARRARELAADLPVEERLVVEARFFESAREWSRAAEIWERLWSAFPDVGGYGLRVAGCRTQAGQPQQALAAALALRNLPPPDGEDPRIDLAEATAAGALADYRRQADAAARAIERAERDGASLIAAEALVVRGWALRNLGRTAEARAAIERGRDLFEARGNRTGVSSADSALGGVLSDLGEPDAARLAYERSLTVAQELGDRGAEALALNNLAVLARNRGENEAARASYERTVALFEETGNRLGAAFAANNLAVCLTELGEFSEAGRRAASALSLWRESGDKGGLAAALGTLGGIRRRTGDLPGAADAWREALALRRETGQRPGEAVALNGLATTLLEGGDLAGAQGHFAAAETLARELGAKSILASALAGLSEVAAARARSSEALSALAEAQSLRRELGQRGGVARLRVSVARLDLEANPRAAAGAAREVLSAPREERAPEVEAAARIVAARALVASGDGRGARETLAVPELVESLGAAQRFEWRISSVLAASAEDRVAAQTEIDAVRREATAGGFVAAELDAALAEVYLTGAGAAELAARARAAGYEALALRAERRAEER